MNKTAIIATTVSAVPIARKLAGEFPGAGVYVKGETTEFNSIASVSECVAELFDSHDALLFIGAMGICVRTIAPHIRDKYTDPAVVCIDTTGRFAISVLSGHVGGANELTDRVARTLQAEPVVTTRSDNTGLWPLDILGERFGWKTETDGELNSIIADFVNERPTAVLLDIRDDGTAYLERTKPAHVDVYYRFEQIDLSRYGLVIVVSPFVYQTANVPVLYYRPAVLHLGVGCRKECRIDGIAEYIGRCLAENHISPKSVTDISTIDLKKDEPLMRELSDRFGDVPVHIYTADELKDIEVPNPSEKVMEVTTVAGVSEAAALKSADNGPLLVEKQKGRLSEGNDFTFAVAMDRRAVRNGHIEIVGAGPGDPDLVSVRGRQFLENADLILYAGSLVPIELTHCAKPDAVVMSSAEMELNEQFDWMKRFYDDGKLVVRLHTGDPCIYGAIQEQMALFDRHGMSYHITPGISSFQAAAAALNSQFTIPERVQTIILTRGEGRTPMPEKEKLHLLARSQSTMCIFLSASMGEEVQRELLEHYPPETPVAACYKLTWPDERIYRGQLKDLAQILRDNKLTLTTMIVVGEAIDNRSGLSRLYADEFKHMFRP